MGRHRHRPRKPFDWLGERKHRRGAAALIRQAIQEGWLDGEEHSGRRDRLVAALTVLLDIEELPTREVIGVCRAVHKMDFHDMEQGG